MVALYANDYQVPDKKIVINLSPAEQKNNSPIFDLAMAIAIMGEADEIRDPIPEQAAFLGVLSLDGSIKPVDGMLPAIIAARQEGFKILYLPPIDDIPLIQIDGIEFRFVETLQDVIESFSGQLTAFTSTSTLQNQPAEEVTFTHEKDFQHVIGHEQAKRALEIAAAGGHHYKDRGKEYILPGEGI